MNCVICINSLCDNFSLLLHLFENICTGGRNRSSRENKSLLYFKNLNTSILIRNIKLLFPYFVFTWNALFTLLFLCFYLLWLFHFRLLFFPLCNFFNFNICLFGCWSNGETLRFFFLQWLKISVQCWRPRLYTL